MYKVILLLSMKWGHIMTKKIKKGFTLVELVVVISVIAVLGAVSVGAYFGVTDSANESKVTQEIKELYNLLKLDVIANGVKEDVTFAYNENGFKCNNYQKNSIKKLIEDATSRDDYYYDAGLMNTTFETSEFDQIYFYTTALNNNFEINYMGYLSKDLDTKYTKFMDMSTGELVDEITNSNYVDFTSDTVTYTVSFLVNGEIYHTEHILENTLVNQPIDPNYEGYNFIGWKNGDTYFDFSTLITSDLVLSAEFEIRSYTITFEDEYNLENNFTATYSYSTLLNDILPSGQHTADMTFECWTYENGEVVQENSILTSDIKLIAKYHLKRVNFHVAEGRTLYDISSKRKEMTVPYKEIKYNDRFNNNHFDVSTSGNEVFTGWIKDGKPVLAESITMNFLGDLDLTESILLFEMEGTGSSINLVSYIDTNPVINLRFAKVNGQTVSIKNPKTLFSNFRDIKFFSCPTGNEKSFGILKGQYNIEELYPAVYTSETNSNYHATLKRLLDCEFDEVASHTTKLHTIYAEPQYSYNNMAYSYAAFSYKSHGVFVNLVLLNSGSSLSTACAQGLADITKTMDLTKFPTTITHISRQFCSNLYNLEYFIVPKTVTQIQSEAFSERSFNVFFEWDKQEFVNQNKDIGYYSTGHKGKMYYEGEWEYNENGIPTPLIEK